MRRIRQINDVITTEIPLRTEDVWQFNQVFFSPKCRSCMCKSNMSWKLDISPIYADILLPGIMTGTPRLCGGLRHVDTKPECYVKVSTGHVISSKKLLHFIARFTAVHLNVAVNTTSFYCGQGQAIKSRVYICKLNTPIVDNDR